MNIGKKNLYWKEKLVFMGSVVEYSPLRNGMTDFVPDAIGLNAYYIPQAATPCLNGVFLAGLHNSHLITLFLASIGLLI